MARANAPATLLFWLMALLAAAVLAPSLLLPAWLERQAQVSRFRAHQEYLTALEDRLRAVRKQIEHLNTDPAYVLRLAEQDFGDIKLPKVQTIRIEPDPHAKPAGRGPTADRPGQLPELGALVDEAMRSYPQLEIFVDPHTRPTLLAMGGVLLLAAVILVGTPRSPKLTGPIRANRPADW